MDSLPALTHAKALDGQKLPQSALLEDVIWRLGTWLYVALCVGPSARAT
jgi:hypothetical protein